ncbi:MAG: BsuPI-related putative proteinase inhibitor [Candidatus Solibacter sp.]
MKQLQLLAAAALLVGVASGADFFPLASGNTWTYKDARFGQTFSVKVGLPFFINERVYYSLTGYTDARQLVRLDDRGELVYLDADRQLELPLTSFEPFEGGWWDAPGRTCTDWGQTLAKRTTHEGPAGTFNGVLEVRYRTFTCADAGLQLEQYAENIGMVRRVKQSFAGPVTFDLVSARVGKLRLDSVAGGQFKVTAEPTTDQLAITMTLETPEPVNLWFPSGQDYDVVIFDSNGRGIWRWSIDKTFLQALRQSSLGPLWTVTVKAPPLPAGSYLVSAWLTTLGDVPLYAATAPLTLKDAR